MKIDDDPQRRWFRDSAFVVGSILLIAVVLDSSLVRAQVDPSNDYLRPPVVVQELFDRDKNLAELDRISPNGSHFLIPFSDELSSLELMARRTLRLGMLELMPEVDREWRLATYGIRGYDVYALEERRRWSIDVPEGSFVSDAIWSPDGSRLAFLAHLAESTQVWTADVSTGAAERLSDARVMATLAARGGAGVPSRMLQWMPDGSVLALLVPTGRGSEPEADPVPTGPIVRRTREKATPTRTLPFLLRSEHDADLFRYYTTAQLARLSSGQPPQPIGDPAMYLSIALSPDGGHILAEQLVEPFSYIVGYTSFGRDLNVLNLDGDVVSTIRQIPLYESSERDNRPEANLPREVAWRPDGRGLSWLARTPNAAEEGDDTGDTEQQDRVMGVEAPFVVTEAKVLTSTEGRFSDLHFDAAGDRFFAEITEDGERTILAYDMSVEPAAGQVLVSYDQDNVLELPGEILTRQDGNGITTVMMSSNGQSAYLRGSGYREQFSPQPFVDRVEIANGATTRLFEGAAETFDWPLTPLNDDLTRMIVSREMSSMVPDSYLWSTEGAWENLTQNVDPYPEITAAQRIDFEFTRRDGLTVQARISLPTDYQSGERVPAIFWTYPREYASAEEYKQASIRARNHNAFSPLSFLRWSDIWLTQGYAVVYPDIPILGQVGRFNDHFVADMTETMYAAIRKVDEMGYVDVDRIGHGGHSYGAFATANLLAHTPFFKAGIAGDGAYNRTLTPMTFQGEQRFIWDAPTTYLEISPFFYADQIHSPLLMYHGEQDNNSGTFLIQSERMMQALTGLGKKAALYIYPFESHGPRAKENYLDLWTRWLEWFDLYVKGQVAPRTETDGL
jgi:dipeptidyl aminopeptidase/acylaminoacyl peptidase